MQRPALVGRPLRSVLLHALLAVHLAFSPVVAMAAEAHEALHAAHGEAHTPAGDHEHLLPDGRPDVSHSPGGQVQTDDPVHALAHVGHCCGLLSAITASAPDVPVPHNSHAGTAFRSDDRAQQIPAPLLKPPKH